MMMFGQLKQVTAILFFSDLNLSKRVYDREMYSLTTHHSGILTETFSSSFSTARYIDKSTLC